MKIEWICLLILGLCLVANGAYVNEDADENSGSSSNSSSNSDDGGSNGDSGDDVSDSGDGYDLIDLSDLGDSVDDLIVNATEDAKEFDFFYSPNAFDPEKSLIKVEFDMVFTAKEYEEMNSPSRRKRTAGIRNGAQGGYRWKNNHIPYQIASGVFNSYQRNEILGAMRDWSKYTCLTFSAASQGNRIYFNNGGGCYSRVGMVGGAQTIGLATNCRVKHVITHEVGHAIGLHHEQTRPDRDQYVKILTQNIPDSIEYNFKRYSWNVIQQMHIPYDYLSIMHYGARAFSYNNGLTIQTKDPRYQNIIGRRNRLSFRDIKSVNIMYNCRDANKCRLKDSDCPGEGFVGKDCKCWCPGDPYTLCKDTTTTTTGKKTTKKPTVTKPKPKPTKGPTTSCYNRHTRCAYWASYGHCTKSYAYMSNYCRKSCGLCSGGTTTTAKSCRDLHTACPGWSRYGYCTTYSYRLYMQTNCKQSCGYCKNSAPNSASTCKDSDDFCKILALNGHCKISRNYMQSKCQKSCDFCSSSSQGVQTTSNCVDKNTYCKSWADNGECAKNPRYMLVSCQKSCNVKNC